MIEIVLPFAFVRITRRTVVHIRKFMAEVRSENDNLISRFLVVSAMFRS